MDECAVCLENLQNPTQLQPCRHKFCTKCIRRMLQFDAKCPSCRVGIQGLNGDARIQRVTQTASIRLDATGKFGMALIGCDNEIRVKSVRRGSPAFRGGMRANDIVLAVNSVPCFTKNTTVQLMSHVDRTTPVVIHIDRVRRCGCLGF
jgi:predicted metalloprotease with PDZ domain